MSRRMGIRTRSKKVGDQNETFIRCLSIRAIDVDGLRRLDETFRAVSRGGFGLCLSWLSAVPVVAGFPPRGSAPPRLSTSVLRVRYRTASSRT